MRPLTFIAVATVLLALVGCVPVQFSARGIEDALGDHPAVSEMSTNASERRIGALARITTSVTLKSGSTAQQAGDIVATWFDAIPDSTLNTIQLAYPEHERYGMSLTEGENSREELRAAAIQWSTLALLDPTVTGNYTSADDSTIGIVSPRMSTPGDVRALVDNVRGAIAGVESPTGWWLRTTNDVGADQGLELRFATGLPDDQTLSAIETLDVPFASAGQVGGVFVDYDVASFGVDVGVSLSPEEFRQTPVSGIPELIPGSDVWPVIQQFIVATGQSANRITFSLFTAPVASLATSSCDRPESERFPLDDEVWEDWASQTLACS